MKLYRASYRDGMDEHQGYEWFTNRRAAEAAQKQNLKLRMSGDNNEEEFSKIQQVDDVEEIELLLTKTDVMRVLNQFGSHPNNG